MPVKKKRQMKISEAIALYPKLVRVATKYLVEAGCLVEYENDPLGIGYAPTPDGGKVFLDLVNGNPVKTDEDKCMVIFAVYHGLITSDDEVDIPPQYSN